MLLSCTSSSILRVDNNHTNEIVQSNEEHLEESTLIAPDLIALLFYKETANVIKVEETVASNTHTQPAAVNPRDYRFIADWSIDGVFFVKILYIPNNTELTINNKSNNYGIVIIEKTPYAYKLQVNGNIIEVTK